VHTADFYYDILCRLTDEVDLWETHYYHIMRSHADIVQWYSGSGLRQYLDCLQDKAENAAFLSEYEAALKPAYPIQADGRILFSMCQV
jgi:trans-aconitate 2-methyltransferase